MRAQPPPRRPRHALAFKRRLLGWFREEGRALPWRETRDPYRVLVSEIMLQQTQVSRVEDYYHRFLERYPTIHSLAEASTRSVRESWDGLGYYRRAANLHAAAKNVVSEHDGVVPDDTDTLRSLPGIGTYTAGAVAAFAYERRVPAIDTNVERVLRRVFLPRLGNGAAAAQRLDTLGQSILPVRRSTAWEFSQAVMDLGALICTARNPKCGECPVRPTCQTGRKRRERRSG